jgi:uncharacterized protein YecE (DUF72 family)
MKNWYLGTIGYSYRDWIGSFYPSGTTQRGFLSYFSKIFNTVELNTTFYAIPRSTTFQSWVETTPNEFRFCVKTPRRITHELGLKDAQASMDEFIDSLQPLHEKLGPILIQLPPKYSQDNFSILEEFLKSLPHSYLYAIEFRNKSWYNQRTSSLLGKYQVCWVSTDYPNLPNEITLTSNFIYIRWIGINGMFHHHSYERVNKNDEFRWWLENIQTYSNQISTLYGFFNNDYAGFAPGTCTRFKQFSGIQDEIENQPYQSRLF